MQLFIEFYDYMNNDISCRLAMLLLFILCFYLIVAGLYGLRWTEERSLYTILLSLGLSLLASGLTLLAAYWLGYYLQRRGSRELIQLGLSSS